MNTYATLAVTFLVIGVVYRKIILKLGYYCIMAIGVAFAYRVATLVDTRMSDHRFELYPIVGGIAGFVVVGILCANRIRHLLIWFYLQRAIQRDRDAAKAGRLW